MHDVPFLQLLPVSAVVLEESLANLDATVHAAEAALVAGAVDKRRREFAAGRLLAHQALAILGHPQAPIGADPHGVPAWPRRATGCITHAGGRVAVAVAARDHVQAIGIDMEAVDRFLPGLEGQVLSGRELRQLAGVSQDRRRARAAVLFCAKEAWFKCQFPLLQRRLGFHEAEVEVDWDSGRFVVRPPDAGDPNAEVAGCSSVQDGVARAAIVLAADASTPAILRAWRSPGGD